MESVRVRTRNALIVAATLVAGLTLSLVPASPVQAAPPSLAEAKKQVDALGRRMDQINEQLNTAKVDLAAVRAKQATLAKKLVAAQKAREAAQAKVGELASAAYRGGQLSLEQPLLSGASTGQYMEQMLVLDQISQTEKAVIDRAEQSRKAVNSVKAAVNAEVAKAAGIQKTLADRKKALGKDLAKWEQLRRTAYVKLYGTAPSRYNYTGPASGNARIVVEYALAQQGKPYVFGADGPGSFDCSGLTLAAWRQVGVSLPHSSRKQYAQINKISRANLEPGDLVFFYSDLHHSAVYVGNGKVVHAPQSGDVVKVVSLGSFPYAGAGRP